MPNRRKSKGEKTGFEKTGAKIASNGVFDDDFSLEDGDQDNQTDENQENDEEDSSK